MLIFNAHGVRKMEYLDSVSLYEPRFELVNDTNIYVTFTKTGEKMLSNHANLITYSFLNPQFKKEVEKIVKNVVKTKPTYLKLVRIQEILLQKL